MLDGFGEKPGKLLRASYDVFFIEDSLSQAAEKAGRAAFQHFATRTEQRGIGINGAAEIEKVALVSAGAVQKQQSTPRFSWHELVDKIEAAHDKVRGGSARSIDSRCTSYCGGRRKL